MKERRNEKDTPAAAFLTVELLAQLHQPNQSLRQALAQARQQHEPRNTRLWNMVHAWIMEVQKRQGTIDTIERLAFDHPVKEWAKPIVDLATYWQYWGRRSGKKITEDSQALVREQGRKMPRWLVRYLHQTSVTDLASWEQQLPDERQRWAFRHSLPLLLYDQLRQVHNPSELESLGQWWAQKPVRYLAINPLLGSPDKTIEELMDQTRAKPIPEVPYAFELLKGKPIQHTGVYNQGRVLLVDVAAQAVTGLLPVTEGMVVADLCAAPGNKTVLLAGKTKDATILAGDLPGSRHTLLEKRIKFMTDQTGRRERAALRFDVGQGVVVKTQAWDATSLPLEDGSMDGVFLDAPCTGSGTLGSKPDVRQTLTPEFLTEHLHLQQALLREAGRVTKIGGHLLYITCSVLPTEDEGQVNDFLAVNQTWSVDPLHHPFATESKLLPGTLRFFPPQSRSEGFYAALLKRGGHHQEEN